MGSSFNKMSSYFFQKEEARVLMQGLDAAGKTTVLYALKLGEVVTTIPTIGFNVETVEFKNISITAWDVGVDCNDRDRVDEASKELHTTANEEELCNIPILILANKQDLPNAMSTDELRDKLALNKFTRERKWHIQGTVATEKKGLREGFDWLADALATKNVETYGTMGCREKLEFLLEQMRLCLAKHDYTRTQIISQKT
ncbi:unnamed protein product [Rotaria socialis]